MTKQKVLILTDHRNHSSENSLYALSVAMHKSSHCKGVDIASRYNERNKSFFEGDSDSPLWVRTIDADFRYSEVEHPLDTAEKLADISEYDLVWLRLPPPLDKATLKFFYEVFRNQLIINDPRGIYNTGSKAFLTEFPTVCPPMQVCRSIEGIRAMKDRFPIVLKPFREYGGKGIIRIDGEQVWDGKRQLSYNELESELTDADIEYLAVKFLKNVGQGDKRIVVVNGEILGASLRLPPKDSWICNVALGGSSHETDITAAEIKIVDTINPTLQKMGIVMYGVDTLVGDDGERVLSEINTTSIGGLPQIAALNNEPLVERAIELIWDYYYIVTKYIKT